MADNTCVEDVSRRSGRGPLIALSIGLYLVLCAIMFVRIRAANDHHFLFSLDDPYIHLALAKAIRHGHYGINAAEFSSPSSSILWPLLLVPFAAESWGAFWALALNLIAGALAAVLFGSAVAAWPSAGERRDERLRRFLAVIFLLFIGNLVGLTFLGMEHTLQVLLAGAVAVGMIRCLQHRDVPGWILAAAIIGPSVRYENLGLSLALAIALVGQGRRRLASAVFAASLTPLIAFSLFLKHLGLPALPTSVLIKGGMQSAGPGALAHLLTIFVSTLKGALIPDHTILIVLFLTLAGLTWVERDRVRRFALAGAAVAAGLHLAIGRFNWFHRYEVYVVLFSALIVLHVLHERPRMLLGWFVLGLLACAGPYLDAWRTTIGSSHQIYLQQYQMHRFATSFYTGNVAINDLGLMSYDRLPDQYVLDLYGLGSVEAERHPDKDPAWLDAITREHRVGLVMVYHSWFPDVPADWTRIGALCLTTPPIAVHEACVQFYATPLGAANDLRRKFIDFARTLPDDGVVAVAANDTDEAALARP